MMTLPSILLGLLPVLLFLTGLRCADSYELVTRRSVLTAIGIGCLAALACYFLNRAALSLPRVDPLVLRRYVAPALEEGAKAIFVAHLIRSEKVGFMVDAGIQGFAVGTGFALVENAYYADALGGASFVFWVVRGLGTAVMHGSATAIVGILSKSLADRRQSSALVIFLPGLAVAVVSHSLFNHLGRYPLIATAFVLVAMPLLLLLVFERSERATRDWLGAGLDTDMELLELILDGTVAQSRVGRYLESLKTRFPGPVVADMLCLLHIHLELALRAKGILIARAAGVEVPRDPSVQANLQEMRYLEKAIGPAGRMAVLPLRRTSGRDLWQLYMLQK
jgi:RsiW-degrading membrane proteinase PrsW (M82 family)